MARWLGRFSIRTFMGLVIVTIAALALSYAARTLIDAGSDAREAARAAMLTRASRGLLRTILPARLERGSILTLGGAEPAGATTLSTIAASRQAFDEGYRAVQRQLRDLNMPSVDRTLGHLEAAGAALNALRPPSMRPCACRRRNATRPSSPPLWPPSRSCWTRWTPA